MRRFVWAFFFACAISTSSADISTFNIYSYLMGLQTLFYVCIYNKSILDVRADSFELSLVACAISTSSTDISTFYMYRFPDSVERVVWVIFHNVLSSADS